MGIRTTLPTTELGLYSLVLSGALAYAGRGLLEASQGNSRTLEHRVGGTLLSLWPQASTQQGHKLKDSRPRIFQGSELR